MKRLISLIVIGGLVLSLCSCDSEEQDRSSQTERETEVEETTESESVSTETTESEPTESEPTESETMESETSEETSEETTTSETETETEAVTKKDGSLFIDCSGKSADEIVANIIAIRTIKSGDTAKSYADRFDIAPDWSDDNNYDEDSVNIGFMWYPEMVGSNDRFTGIRLDTDFESDGQIKIVGNSNAEITLELSDLETAKDVYEKVKYIIAVDDAKDDEGNYDEEDISLDDDRDKEEWVARYSARSVSLSLNPNVYGNYVLSIEIDLVNA